MTTREHAKLRTRRKVIEAARQAFNTDGRRVFSLRSRVGGADVSEIARSYGGGGHMHAGGFSAAMGWEGDR